MNNNVCLENEDLRCLVDDITALLTGGVWDLELSDKVWCSLIRLSTEDFYSYIYRWIIDNKFTNFFGKNITASDICLSLTTSSFDYELLLAQAYSEDVGLSSRGGRYELQKGFVEIVDGQQVYEIPAGREIKKVLFVTPSSIDAAKFASWGYGNLSMAQMSGLGTFGTIGFGSGYGAVYPLFPAHDVVLRAAHFNLNERIFKSELTYRITKGPNGTRLLHLFSIPSYDWGLRRELYSSKVWYEYYDVSEMGDEEKALCQQECNKIYAPHQIDLPKQDYCDLNLWGKNFLRKWLTAMAKETLGRARGKFKGKLVNMGGVDLELDYDLLLAEAKEEFAELKKDISEFLLELRSDKQLERRANEAENLTRVLALRPLGFEVI
ncbi:MAG: hypothetical protein KDC90_03180 [Ignavibacteriae bacterium]|nr:hypothetical protein [Ignavibacteriota bacterium]